MPLAHDYQGFGYRESIWSGCLLKRPVTATWLEAMQREQQDQDKHLHPSRRVASSECFHHFISGCGQCSDYMKPGASR